MSLYMPAYPVTGGIKKPRYLVGCGVFMTYGVFTPSGVRTTDSPGLPGEVATGPDTDLLCDPQLRGAIRSAELRVHMT
jgi:hypothetical protein